jgi:chromosome segregation ATPase
LPLSLHLSRFLPFTQLSTLEILAETLTNDLDERERELSRARNARAEYATESEELQRWLQSAEARIRDTDGKPEVLREKLAAIGPEAGSAAERLEHVARCAQLVGERSPDPAERDLANSTLASLTEGLAHVRHSLEQRKMAVGEAVDGWKRFLDLHDGLVHWCEEKKALCDAEASLPTLGQARQRLSDLSSAVKTTRYATKNLQEMEREHARIAAVADADELAAILDDDENAKSHTEGQLAEKVIIGRDKCAFVLSL